MTNVSERGYGTLTNGYTDVPNDELAQGLAAVGSAINDQITNAVERQGRDLRGQIEAQGSELTDKIESQRSELTGKIEQQGRDLTGKIEQQGRDVMGKIEAHARRTEGVERQLDRLDANVSSLSKTLDRQQNVILALVGLLGAAVVGLLILFGTIAFGLHQEPSGTPSSAQVPAAVEESSSPQPTAGLSNETESAESTIAMP